MLDGERLRSRMSELGISQAALARRVGVSQQTIGRLVSGDATGSKYLHRIARELSTTPAWLERETNDPNSDAPEAEYSADERGWIESLRALSTRERAAVVSLIRALSASEAAPTLHDKRPDFRGDEKDERIHR